MTKYFYDTEFLDDGNTIELISIGIVCEDGREYYAVNADFDINRIKKNDWILRNVIPHLPLTGRTSLEAYIVRDKNFYPKPPLNLLGFDQESVLVKPKWVIANEVRAFMLDRVDLTVGPTMYLPELWAYYAAYDHVALAQLWGPMIKLPKGIPMWTHDLMQLIHDRQYDGSLPDNTNAHNALEDARWNALVYKELTS